MAYVDTLKNVMHFPLYLHLGGLEIHPHLAFEGLAYLVGVVLYFRLRLRHGELSSLPHLNQQIWLLVGGVFGGFAGARLLAAWEAAPLLANPVPTFAQLGGKTVVGGLVGGWFGVEVAKRRLGIVGSSGDAWVFPILIGLMIGRIGCFLTGLADHTCGIETTLPWGIDFGDGLHRHPAQLYEILLLGLVGVFLFRHRADTHSGELFRLFMLLYALVRLGLDFLKPSAKPYAGLSAIQLVALMVIGYICWWYTRRPRRANHER